MTEHDLQKAVASYLDWALPSPEAVWFAVPNGGKRHVAVGAKLKAEGVKPGVADIIVIWKGRALAIELKVGRNGQQHTQKAWQEAFTLAGGVYCLCKSMDAVYDFLDAAGVPMQGEPQ